MKPEEYRTCGICGVRDIPFGVDWPTWTDGKPAHPMCRLMVKAGARVIDLPVAMSAKRSEEQ